MNKIKTLFLTVVLLSLVISCQPQEEILGISVFELKVTNLSKSKIYPALSSGKSEQDFGVVGVGNSATIGFSPFRVGDEIKVEWKEAGKEEDFSKTFNTSRLLTGVKSIYTLNFVYMSSGNWNVRILDKEEKVLNSISQ